MHSQEKREEMRTSIWGLGHSGVADQGPTMNGSYPDLDFGRLLAGAAALVESSRVTSAAGLLPPRAAPPRA